MPVSKADIARVLLGEKRHRAFKEQMLAAPVKRKVGTIVRKAVEYVPEEVNVEQARLSGGVVASVPMRNADGKFVRHQREFSGQCWQGKIEVSKIDGHVYGSRQKVGRTLEEWSKDEGYDHPDKIIGGEEDRPSKGKNPSAFKRHWKDSTFVVEYKK